MIFRFFNQMASTGTCRAPYSHKMILKFPNLIVRREECKTSHRQRRQLGFLKLTATRKMSQSRLRGPLTGVGHITQAQPECTLVLPGLCSTVCSPSTMALSEASPFSNNLSGQVGFADERCRGVLKNPPPLRLELQNANRFAHEMLRIPFCITASGIIIYSFSHLLI